MWCPQAQYSIPHNIIPYMTPILYVLGLVWIGGVALLNIAAVGYDSVSVYSTSFNTRSPSWDERWSLLKSFFPPSWSCTPSVINSAQSLDPLVHTTNGFVQCTLIVIEDNRPGVPIHGMLYANAGLQNCSLQSMDFQH